MATSTKTKEEPLCTKVTSPIFKVPILEYHFSPTLCGEPLQGVGSRYFLVEAPNPINAMLQVTREPGYRRNYNNMTREERKEVKGPKFRLDTGEKIERMPDCELRHKNRDGQYTCGEVTGEYADNNGEFGMCVLQGYDIPESDHCPFYKESIYSS